LRVSLVLHDHLARKDIGMHRLFCIGQLLKVRPSIMLDHISNLFDCTRFNIRLVLRLERSLQGEEIIDARVLMQFTRGCCHIGQTVLGLLQRVLEL